MVGKMLRVIEVVEIVRQSLGRTQLRIHERPSYCFLQAFLIRAGGRRSLPRYPPSASGDLGFVSPRLSFLLQGPRPLVAYAPWMIERHGGYEGPALPVVAPSHPQSWHVF